MTSTLNNSDGMGRAFVPGHITGIFSIYDMYDNPLLCGSMGAGFCIKAGTVTDVREREHESLEVTVEYNHRKIDGPVTKMVVELMSAEYKRSFKVEVRHESELPIGVGFGASGAGALGTALALNAALGGELSEERAAQLAHIAEVSNHTGLGDVLAQTTGGFEIRTEPGAPGIGKVMNIISPENYGIVLAGAGGLETRDILTDPESRRKINEVGEHIIKKIIASPTVETFILCSREFVQSTGLMSERAKNALDELSSNSFVNSSMVMLGNSVFCLCDETEVEAVIEILSDYWLRDEILSTGLQDSGGRVV